MESSHVSSECDIQSVDLSVVDDANGLDIGIGSVDMLLRFSDYFNNPMPAGTTVNISTNNGELSGTTSMTVGSTNSRFPLTMAFNISREGEGNKKSDGVLTIEITTPRQIVTALSLGISDDR